MSLEELLKSNSSANNATGDIALISQSSAVLAYMQNIAAEEKLGWSALALTDNKASLDEVDFIGALKDDENTKVIAAYLENITRGKEFMRVVENVSNEKPIVIFKTGRTKIGMKAVLSRTGNSTGTNDVYTAVFDRFGIIRAVSIEELFDYSMAFSYMPLPADDRVAIVTNAGGFGIVMTDALELSGLNVVPFGDATCEQLKGILPAAVSANNPLDISDDATDEMYGKVMDVVIESPEIDSMIVILAPQKAVDAENVAKKIVELSKTRSKPIFACFVAGGTGNIAEGISILREKKIPQYATLERAANAMSGMIKYVKYKKRPPGRFAKPFDADKKVVKDMIELYRSENIRFINERDAKVIMKAYGLNFAAGGLARSASQAGNVADELGYPVVMKISNQYITRKTDFGGVMLDLKTRAEVEQAYADMMTTVKERARQIKFKSVQTEEVVDTIGVVLVEKMIGNNKDDKEVIICAYNHKQFGKIMIFGLGGIYAEVLNDVCFELAPLTLDNAMRLIMETRARYLLNGVRGTKRNDVASTAAALVRISQLICDFDEIAELGINPLKVHVEGAGATILDAKIILTKQDTEA